MYDYMEAIKQDIREAIEEDYNIADYESRDEMEEKLNDELWIDDSVTGNASGSYYCNSSKAREAVLDNMDIVAEALREFCTPAEEIGERFLNEDWEWLDVTARCYLLGQAIGEVLDEMEEAGAFDQEEQPDIIEDTVSDMGRIFDQQPETVNA